MAKLIKFPLEMADGTKARSIEELREHADIASIAAYYENGKLYRWLLANYLDDEAEKVEKIQEFTKFEVYEITRKKIWKLYDALGISKPDDGLVESYLSEQPVLNSDCKNKHVCNFEVEDDTDLKAELSKIIQGKVNLDEWNIAREDTEEEDLYYILLEEKQHGIYTNFLLKKDKNFYLRIAHFIENCKKSLCTDFKNQEYEAKKFAEFQAQIQKIPSRSNLTVSLPYLNSTTTGLFKTCSSDFLNIPNIFFLHN